MSEFIRPNWHVVLIHWPLATVTLGVLVELLSLFCTRWDARIAARWMILIGAIFAAPTSTLGLYAMRDVVTSAPMDLSDTWSEVVGKSHWSDEQWKMMSDHVWLNSIATVLLLLVVCVWIAGSNAARRTLYWPSLALLVVALLCMLAGAWHGGELVYVYGAGVQQDSQEAAPGAAYYLPPLQLHVLFAGLLVSAAMVASALVIRRWRIEPVIPVEGALRSERAVEGSVTAQRPIDAPLQAAATVLPPPEGRPARYWLTGTVLGLLTAFFGLWATAGELTGEAIKGAIEAPQAPGNERLLWHVIVGVSIVVLTLIIAAVARLGPRRRALASIPIALLLLLAVMQLWLGIAILFDSGSGPLFQFNTATTTRAMS